MVPILFTPGWTRILVCRNLVWTRIWRRASALTGSGMSADRMGYNNIVTRHDVELHWPIRAASRCCLSFGHCVYDMYGPGMSGTYIAVGHATIPLFDCAGSLTILQHNVHLSIGQVSAEYHMDITPKTVIWRRVDMHRLDLCAYMHLYQTKYLQSNFTAN